MNKKNKAALWLATGSCLILLIFPFFVQAEDPPPTAPTPPTEQSTALANPLGESINSPVDLYARIIFAFMGIAGVVALIMFIIGGFQWMTAAGAADKIKKGKDTLIWAALGLILIFASYAILRAIFETLKF